MRSSRFDAIRAWCESHPALIAGMCVPLVCIAREAAGAVRIGQATRYGERLPMRRDLVQWLTFYHDHRRVLADLESFGARLPSLTAVPNTLRGLVASVAAIPDEAEPSHPLAERCGQRLLAWFFDSFEAEGDSTPFEAADIGHPSFAAVWFYLTVTLPSMLVFRTCPQQLLRRARHGERSALGALAALDPSVTFERRVAMVLHADPTLSAFARRPPRLRFIRPLAWKTMAAATLRILAIEVKYPLAHHAIRDLFRAFAVDVDGASDDRDLRDLADRTFERRVALLTKRRTALLLPMSAVKSADAA